MNKRKKISAKYSSGSKDAAKSYPKSSTEMPHNITKYSSEQETDMSVHIIYTWSLMDIIRYEICRIR